MSQQQVMDYLYKDKKLSRDTLHFFGISAEWFVDGVGGIDRILIPFYSLYDELLGTVERRFVYEPKYLYPAGFPRGSCLFGLNLSWKDIFQKNVVVVVEGIFDMMVLYQEGFRNVVAVGSNILTFTQACLLRRFCDKVILLFDGDKGGIEGSMRSEEVLERAKLKSFNVRLPAGLDPDAFLISNGKEALSSLLLV